MRLIVLAISCCLGLPLSADTVPLKIEDCVSSGKKGALLCSVTNTTEFSVGTAYYRFVLRSEGRSYPWHISNGSVVVPGGIEPSETVELTIDVSEPALDTQKRMEGQDVLIEKSAWAHGVSSVEIGSNQGNFGSLFSPCWNVGSLSRDALQTSITVIFDLSDAGVEFGSIKPKMPISSSAEKQAFEAARRAILRCGAQGIPSLPSGSANGPVEVTFDARKMHVR